MEILSFKNRCLGALLRHCGFLLSDKLFIELSYYYCTGGKRLNLKNPLRYNEKLQWLKLYDRNPLYTTLVDKYAVKEWVQIRSGKDIVIPTFFVWDQVDDIEWDKLPNSFVLKTTHSGDSVGVVICKEKLKFDKQKAINELNKSMRTDYYKVGREWPYKNVKRRIIAEQFMEDKKIP